MAESMGVVTFLGRLHPMVVHFPIALVIAAAAAEALGAWRPHPTFDGAGHFLAWAAAVTAPPAALLGLAYAWGTTYPPDLAPYFWWHRFAGLTAAILAASAPGVRAEARRRNARGLYALLLAAAALAVSAAGYLGAALTFGPDHLYRP